LQESFIKIFTNLHSYSGEGSFEGWMRRIVVNTALEKYRSRYYLNKVDDPENLAEPDDGGGDTDYAGLEAGDLLEMVTRLPPQYRMVFNLFAIEGYSHREIAEMLSINEGTSKSNLSRARQILQKNVEIYLGIKKRMING
jgi:RNA polymerase sigma-70 factor (ECF subfamily)